MTTTMARQPLTIDTRETINGGLSTAVFEKCHVSRCKPPLKPSLSTEATVPERSPPSSKHHRRRRTKLSSSSSSGRRRRRSSSSRRSSSPSSSLSCKKTQQKTKQQQQQQQSHPSPRRNMPTYEEIKMWSIVSVSAGDSVLTAGGKSQTAKEVTCSVLQSLRRESSSSSSSSGDDDDDDRTMVAAEASTAILAAGGCKYLAMAAMVMILTNYEMGDDIMTQTQKMEDVADGLVGENEEFGRDKREEKESAASGVVHNETREGIDENSSGEYSREMIDCARKMMDEIHASPDGNDSQSSSKPVPVGKSSCSEEMGQNFVKFINPSSPTGLTDCLSPRLLPLDDDDDTGNHNLPMTRSFHEPTKPLTNPSSSLVTSKSLSFEKQSVVLNTKSWTNVKNDIRDLRHDNNNNKKKTTTTMTRNDDKSSSSDNDTSSSSGCCDDSFDNFDEGIREELLSHYLKGYGEGPAPDTSLFDEILKMRFATEGDDTATTTTTHSTSEEKDGSSGMMALPPISSSSPIKVPSLRSVVNGETTASPRDRECLMHIARDIWTSIQSDMVMTAGESTEEDQSSLSGFEVVEEESSTQSSLPSSTQSSLPPPSSSSSLIMDEFDSYPELLSSSLHTAPLPKRATTVSVSNPSSSYTYDFSDQSLKPPKGSFSRRSSLTKVTRSINRKVTKMVTSQKEMVVRSQKKLMTTSHRWQRQCSSLGSL